jgi:hypothetical protein
MAASNFINQFSMLCRHAKMQCKQTPTKNIITSTLNTKQQPNNYSITDKRASTQPNFKNRPSSSTTKVTFINPSSKPGQAGIKSESREEHSMVTHSPC